MGDDRQPACARRYGRKVRTTLGTTSGEDFILPYYQKIWEPLKAAGSTLFSQDSDGFMEPVIRSFLKAGVNVMYPCEPAAGMISFVFENNMEPSWL